MSCSLSAVPLMGRRDSFAFSVQCDTYSRQSATSTVTKPPTLASAPVLLAEPLYAEGTEVADVVMLAAVVVLADVLPAWYPPVGVAT